MAGPVVLEFRTSTTIGIASEILRLALARSVLFDQTIAPARIAWPGIFGRSRYPRAIYGAINAARLVPGQGFGFFVVRIYAFLAHLFEVVFARIGFLGNSSARVPIGQEGLYKDSPDLFRQNLGTSSRFGALRRIARAVRGFGPVTLNDNAIRRCAIDLTTMGVGTNDWFVCLHVRTSAFHKDHSDYRNARFDHYSLAIDHIIALGGKVVRMGDPGVGIVTCLRPELIDYPNTPWKSELMDLYLIKRCRFYIGTLSGILDTSYLLHTPTLCVNSLHFDMRSPNPCDRVLYKNIRRKSESRSLTFAEALSSFHDILAQDWSARYEFLENSDVEILAAVREFLSVIDGTSRVTPRQVKARRRLVRERLKFAASHGGAHSMLAASIAFSRCHIVDFALSGWKEE